MSDGEGFSFICVFFLLIGAVTPVGLLSWGNDHPDVLQQVICWTVIAFAICGTVLFGWLAVMAFGDELEDIFSHCTRCGETVTYYKGFWWSNDDQFMCPDGEERHTV